MTIKPSQAANFVNSCDEVAQGFNISVNGFMTEADDVIRNGSEVAALIEESDISVEVLIDPSGSFTPQGATIVTRMLLARASQ